MSIVKDYLHYINLINKGLLDFSHYLQPQYHIPTFDDSMLNDINITWDLTTNGWDNTKFPSSSSRGVYLIFGKKKDNTDKIGVYVGKASFNSFIGSRLYTHLHNPERGRSIYPIGEFLMELVITIPMDKIFIMAPALEEFLIFYLKDHNVWLLNTVGNR